uniref:ARID domain-containing protein n=1 Tax=Clastoptera arizonana TaxID=38151 RepID=A0A1B6CVU6_9HEMI
MDFKLIGVPCGHHGPYTFYKAFKYSKNGKSNILSLSEFFFVKLWNDSDLVSIGELQLLWEDKNCEQTLASLRLYILPESTPDGRSDFHGEHEVLAITEKVVLKVEDLLTWITEAADWSWGLSAVWDKDCSRKMSISPKPQLLPDCTAIDLSDIEKEKNLLDESHWETSCGVVVLSFPRYCRYRGILKRLEGVQNKWLRTALVIALGGFTVPCRNTRILFCKDTFDYPDLEGHELLCNHLAPKLKGRPRKKRKKLSLSPDGSESESGSSLSTVCSTTKHTKSKLLTPTKSLSTPVALSIPNLLSPSLTGSRRSSRNPGSPEEKEFLSNLYLFMKSRQTPINRLPSIGFKEIDLYKFYNKVKHLGGYDMVTANRLWKYVYEEMGGDYGSTSAATCSRRHYEKLLLEYERHLTGTRILNRCKPATIVKARKLFDHSDRTISSVPHTVTPPGKTSLLRSVRLKPEKSNIETSGSTTDPPMDKENIPVASDHLYKSSDIIDLGFDQSTKPLPSSPTSPNFKKQKLEILKEGGLEVTPIATTAVATTNGSPLQEGDRPSVIHHTVPGSKISITVTPDVNHMLVATKTPQRHAWSLGSQAVYGNPKDIVHCNEKRVNSGEILDLRTKINSHPSSSYASIGSNLEITLVPAGSNNTQPRRKRFQNEYQPSIPNAVSKTPLPHQQRSAHIPAQRQPNTSAISNGRLQHVGKHSNSIIPNVSISLNQQQLNHQQAQYNHQPRRARHKAPQLYTGFKPQATPYLPIVDPVYLSAALYGGIFPPNLFPSHNSLPPNQHQMQLYKELIHRHVPASARSSYPENLPCLLKDGSTSITLVGQSSTPTSK